MKQFEIKYSNIITGEEVVIYTQKDPWEKLRELTNKPRLNWGPVVIERPYQKDEGGVHITICPKCIEEKDLISTSIGSTFCDMCSHRVHFQSGKKVVGCTWLMKEELHDV